MGAVMKVVEKKVGDATISTIYHFTEFEDFLYWESGEGGNVEALTLGEVLEIIEHETPRG